MWRNNAFISNICLRENIGFQLHAWECFQFPVQLSHMKMLVLISITIQIYGSFHSHNGLHLSSHSAKIALHQMFPSGMYLSVCKVMHIDFPLQFTSLFVSDLILYFVFCCNQSSCHMIPALIWQEDTRPSIHLGSCSW